MKYPTIRIEGSILAADILENIESGDKITGQKSSDFQIEGSAKVKDEIARAWADAQSYWSIFKRKRELIEADDRQTGTSETRNQWMIPFMGLLGYKLEFSRAEDVMGKSFAISHREPNLDGFPVHIMGFKDNLDVKRKDGGPRMSPHALVQEYLNLTEHLYAVVTNGLQIRLLRDSSRLIKLSFLEFDLERMMDEEHYADFAILYRLLHYTRMPIEQAAASEALIETYHTNSLESGSRIRDGLSKAVELCILQFSNGFLQHPKNKELRDWIEDGDRAVKEKVFYQWQLRLIYRLLFLMVIEERDLIYPKETDKRKKAIYYDFYSLNKLRLLSEKRYLADKKYTDYWQSIKNTFRLFENETYGKPLGIQPLGGDLFGYNAVGVLNESVLDNKTVLNCLKSLSLFKNEATGQTMRVNYASLNVEEFGSVYEGLLEYDPSITFRNSTYHFEFKLGDGRSSSGSHYTPDELVQPLIKHSLDYIIKDKLKEANPEQGLLSITVCDVACGSGHILLSAARRIATELAIVRTNEEQPSPTAFREAIRDVIRHCIYGVDYNPLAVELCKVALWLEAHNPNEPLNFLDHHIKCGNSIVGLAHFKELQNGIADEAFKTLPGDDADIAKLFLNKNKQERLISDAEIKSGGQQITLDTNVELTNSLESIHQDFTDFINLPEQTPEEITVKAAAYQTLTTGKKWYRIKQLADLQVAQFFIPKTPENKERLTTQANYQSYLNTGTQIIDRGAATAVGQDKRFFHWFLEFPQVFNKGGFDCVLGNPPFLGDRRIKEAYGVHFLEWIRTVFTDGATIDLVGYFFLRINEVIKQNGFQSLISTNTITQGKAREKGLEKIISNGSNINHAVKSMKWPGLAAVEVSLITLFKGKWVNNLVLDNNIVENITPYLDSQESLGNPFYLKQNEGKSYQGSIVLGMGFVLEPKEAKELLRDDKNHEVLQPYLNGSDLNGSPTQSPSRYVINFHDYPFDKAAKFEEVFRILEEKVKPERWKKNEDEKYPFWHHWRPRNELYRKANIQNKVLVSSRVSKYVSQSFIEVGPILDVATSVVIRDKWYEFAGLQNSFHKEWAWKYASTLESRIRYVNADCIDTFPLSNENDLLNFLGEKYHNHRFELLAFLKLGLTKMYNQFHNKDLVIEVEGLSSKEFQKKYGKETWNLYNHLEVKKEGNISYEEAVPLIEELRNLHKEMDEAVLEAYGWQDIKLHHDFYEVDYLPENDRVRYTIHPDARKEILKRLLLLNHERYEEEIKQGLHKRKDVQAFYKQKSLLVPEDAKFSDAKIKKKSTAKKAVTKKAKTDAVSEPQEIYGQPKLFEEPNLFNTPVSISKEAKVSIVKEDGKSFDYHITMNAQKGKFTNEYKQISPTSALAEVMLGRQVKDQFQFGGQMYTITEVK